MLHGLGREVKPIATRRWAGVWKRARIAAAAMKLGCSSQSYDRAFREDKLDLVVWLKYCAAVLRLDGIEIEDKHFPSTAPDFLRTLRQEMAGRDLALSSVTIMNNFGLPTAVERAAQLDYVYRWLAVTRTLRAPVMRIFAGWPRPEPSEVRWQDMIVCLKQACAAAKEAGVVLSLENHNHGGFVRVAEDAVRVFEEVGSDWLRLNLDTGNYLDGLRSIERTAPWAAHVHAKLYDIAWDGSDRWLDYPKILTVLKQARYRGFLSLEYEGSQDAFEVIPRAVAYFRHLIGQI